MCSSIARADDSVAWVTGILDQFQLLPTHLYFQGDADPARVPNITIDSAAGVSENIFYPFGGVDVITAANSPDVKKIVVAQLESFGNISFGLAAFEEPDFHDEVAQLTHRLFEHSVYGGMESRTLANASEITDGLGVHALMLIERLMQAKIKSIGYLKFANGAWEEIPFGQAPAEPDHGFIEFEYLGRTVKYYLLRADLKDGSKSPIRPRDIALLFNEKPYDTILRHIHGAQGKLKKDFKQLLDVIQSSVHIFTTGEDEEPFSTFPKFQIVLEQPRPTTFSPNFGMKGKITILHQRPRDATDTVTTQIVTAWEKSGKSVLHVGEASHNDNASLMRITTIIRHLWRELDYIALEADASQQYFIDQYVNGQSEEPPKNLAGASMRDSRLLEFLRTINSIRIDQKLFPIKVIALDPSAEGYDDYNSWFQARPAYMYRRLMEQTDSLKQKGIIFTGAGHAARGTTRLPRLARWMMKVESSYTPLGDAIQNKAFSVFLQTNQTILERLTVLTSKSARDLPRTFDFICRRELTP